MLSWPEYIREVKTSSGDIKELLLNKTPLEELTDPREAEALRHALQSYESPVLLLESDTNNLLACQVNDERWLFKYPEQLKGNNLAAVVKYFMNLSQLGKIRKQRGEGGIYYSLDPLVYNREYWTETVCHQELTRHDSTSSPALSLILCLNIGADRIVPAVEKLRTADRPGALDNTLGVLAPFTKAGEAQELSARLKESFNIPATKIWIAGRDFTNLHEMKNKVKKISE